MTTSKLKALFGENAPIATLPPVNPIKKEILEDFSLQLRLDAKAAQECAREVKRLEEQGVIPPCRIKSSLLSASL